MPSEIVCHLRIVDTATPALEPLAAAIDRLAIAVRERESIDAETLALIERARGAVDDFLAAGALELSA